MALKVGLVGLRGIGMTHANAYKEEPLGNLVAVCDVVKERADSTAAKFGVKAYYRLDEMLRNEPELDIVDVTTGGFENGQNRRNQGTAIGSRCGRAESRASPMQ